MEKVSRALFRLLLRRALLRRGRAAREGGQALVEAAIVMPLMTFLILGVIQLVMVQHARIMTEYAAFTAARAGIVWNADQVPMQSAAIISLMPTYEGVFEESDLGNPMQMLKRIVQRALIYQVHRRLPEAIEMLRNGTDAIVDALGGGSSIVSQRDRLLDAIERAADQALINAINDALGGSPDDMVSIQICEPKKSYFGLRSDEIDFDDPANFDHSRLSIKVRYLYMMRVPFANWIIHQAWLVNESGQQLYGAVWNPQIGPAGKGETGFRNVSQPDMRSLSFRNNRRVVQMVAGLADQGVYMVPLYATYTMRMQSNPYKTQVDMLSRDIGGQRCD
ncbi:MAG: pilus assembly protein [Deltaproteobacteria bacterium]|nr:pilus assembly protein [Deltaproteobacteria bacterium]